MGTKKPSFIPSFSFSAIMNQYLLYVRTCCMWMLVNVVIDILSIRIDAMECIDMFE